MCDSCHVKTAASFSRLTMFVCSCQVTSVKQTFLCGCSNMNASEAVRPNTQMEVILMFRFFFFFSPPQACNLLEASVSLVCVLDFEELQVSLRSHSCLFLSKNVTFVNYVTSLDVERSSRPNCSCACTRHSRINLSDQTTETTGNLCRRGGVFWHFEHLFGFTDLFSCRVNSVLMMLCLFFPQLYCLIFLLLLLLLPSLHHSCMNHLLAPPHSRQMALALREKVLFILFFCV